MATRVDTTPPAPSPPPTSSGTVWARTCNLKLVNSPLHSRKFSSSPVLRPAHTLYRASSYSPAQELVCHSATYSPAQKLVHHWSLDVGMNGRAVSPDCQNAEKSNGHETSPGRTVSPDCKSGEKSNGHKPSLGHGLLGIVGAVRFQNPTPQLPPSYARNNVWLSNTQMCSLFHPNPLTIMEPLMVPPIVTFEVQDCDTGNALSNSQNCSTLCKRDMCDSGASCKQVSVDIAHEACQSASVSEEASNGSDVISAKKGSIDLDYDCAGADDEILECDIHEPCKDIHIVDDSAVSSKGGSYCDPEVKQHGIDTDGPSSTISDKSLSLCVGLDVSAAVEGDKTHLCVGDNFRLKKLLSDESGYYENDGQLSPCEWSKGGGDFMEDTEDYEWDDEETDEDAEADESSLELWKSFEDCMLSPQTLNNVPTNVHTRPCQQQIRSPVTTAELASTCSWDYEQCQAGVPEQGTNITSQCEASAHDSITCPGAAVVANSRLNGGHRKQVHFPKGSDICIIHEMVAWDYAYRTARKGPWEQFARDRAHFKRKVQNLASVLEPCLSRKIAEIQSLC